MMYFPVVTMSTGARTAATLPDTTFWKSLCEKTFAVRPVASGSLMTNAPTWHCFLFMPHLFSQGSTTRLSECKCKCKRRHTVSIPRWPRAHVNIQSITSLTGWDNPIKWGKKQASALSTSSWLGGTQPSERHHPLLNLNLAQEAQELREAQNQWDVISSDVPRKERESKGGMCYLLVPGEHVSARAEESQKPRAVPEDTAINWSFSLRVFLQFWIFYNKNSSQMKRNWNTHLEHQHLYTKRNRKYNNDYFRFYTLYIIKCITTAEM